MALRISGIDYESKTVTFEATEDTVLSDTSRLEAAVAEIFTGGFDGNTLRVGMTVEGDGIDENGMFINPRRVR